MANSSQLRIVIDSHRCQGHNRCCSIAPDYFASDEFGNVLLKAEDIVEFSHESKVRLAVANCPEHALKLIEQNDNREGQ